MSLGNTLYDAAKYNGQRDTSFLAWPQFAEKEFTQYTRETILKKKRMLEANLSIVPAMIKRVGRYSIGEGLHPIPETTDAEWNELAREAFESWASSAAVCDTQGKQTFWEMQTYMARAYFGEGESFAGLCNSSVVGAPQIQLYDNFEVRYMGRTGSAPGDAETGDNAIWDAVLLDRNSKAKGYFIQTRDGGDFQLIPAHNMVHIADFVRPNQVRAISPFHAGANSAVDALDIKALEVASVKLHSLLGVLYKKSSGRGAGEQGISGNLRELLAPVTGPSGEEKSGQTALVEQFYAGAATLHLGENDDIKLLSSDRPSINLIEYLEWLYRDVAVSTGLPLEVVWNLSDLGGVNSRIMLADAQFFFDHIQRKIATSFCRRVFVWWASVMMNSGQLPYVSDDRWFNHIHWQGPCKLNIDRNQVSSDIAAVEAGLTNYNDYYSSRGANWKPKLTQRILEEKFKLEQCKAIGVPYLTVFPAKPGAAPQDAPEDFSGSTNAPSQSTGASARHTGTGNGNLILAS